MKLQHALTLIALTGLMGTAYASTQPVDDELHFSCRFEQKKGKHRESCKVNLTFVNTVATSAATVVGPEFKVRCGDDVIYDGIFTAAAATVGVNLDPGMSIVTAYGNGAPRVPALWVDGLLFDPHFERAPADLKIAADGRLLHGICERD